MAASSCWTSCIRAWSRPILRVFPSDLNGMLDQNPPISSGTVPTVRQERLRDDPNFCVKVLVARSRCVDQNPSVLVIAEPAGPVIVTGSSVQALETGELFGSPLYTASQCHVPALSVEKPCVVT